MGISQASLSYWLPLAYDAFQYALLSTSSLVQYSPRDEGGHSNVFNIPDSHNLLPQDLWRCNSHKKGRHLLKCFPVSFWKSM